MSDFSTLFYTWTETSKVAQINLHIHVTDPNKTLPLR